MPTTDEVTAIAEPSRRPDSTSRSRLMPSGTSPMPMPCNPRPMITGASESATAHSSEPSVTSPSTISTSRRLP